MKTASSLPKAFSALFGPMFSYFMTRGYLSNPSQEIVANYITPFWGSLVMK